MNTTTAIELDTQIWSQHAELPRIQVPDAPRCGHSPVLATQPVSGQGYFDLELEDLRFWPRFKVAFCNAIVSRPTGAYAYRWSVLEPLALTRRG